MSTQTTSALRIDRLKKSSKSKQKKQNKTPLEEISELMKKDFLLLFHNSNLLKDVKFLRKMAINIKQLHYDAKNARNSVQLKHCAKNIEHFLTTPIGAPFVADLTLTQAADSFSEQNPKESDLSLLLADFVAYGNTIQTQLTTWLSIRVGR